MTKRKKKEPTIIAHDGREILRRFATLYFFDGRIKTPDRWSRGYPRIEDSSIDGAGRMVMRGLAFKVQCLDRVRGKVLWTVKRGERVPGTHLFQAVPFKGDPDA
jgi:hypothetical protein